MAQHQSLPDSRIPRAVSLVDDRRLFILSGETTDWFFTDDFHGLQTLPEALVTFFLGKGYELVDVLSRADGAGFVQIPPPSGAEAASRRFRERLNRASRAPGGGRRVQLTSDSRRREPPERSVRASGGASADSDSAPPPPPDTSRIENREEVNLLGKYADALDASRERAALIVLWPDTLTLGGQGLAPNVIDIFRQLNRLAGPFRGHLESCTVFVVGDRARMQSFITVMQDVANGPQTAVQSRLPVPGTAELERFLHRICARHGLVCNNPYAVAGAAAARGVTLKGFAYQILRRCFGHDRAVLGKTPLDEIYPAEELVRSVDDVFGELNNLVGLKTVKEEFVRVRRMVEQKTSGPTFARHYLFVGRPGLGKTVVARLLADLLRALGVRKGKFVEMTVADISSAYNAGDVSEKCNAKIREAAGGVLFVDEAYRFEGNAWLREAFSNLLTEMENRRESMTVIFAGYEDTLQKLTRINKGFESRISSVLEFSDYTAEELIAIFGRMWGAPATRLQFAIQTVPPNVTTAAERYVRTLVQRRLVKNARDVRTLVEKVFGNAKAEGRSVLQLQDVPAPVAFNQEAAEQFLEKFEREFCGMRRVKEAFRGIYEQARDTAERLAAGVAEHGCGTLPEDSFNPGGYLFLGPPGTGKTSVARKLQEFLSLCGLLTRGRDAMVAVDPSLDFYATGSQDTGARVAEAFKKAEGCVLFVDEAYRLAEEGEGRTAVNTIVSQMTLPEVARTTAVVLAGYESEMQNLFQVNPGLRSRFPTEVIFEDYTEDELIAIFGSALEAGQILMPVPPECIGLLRRIIANQKCRPGFANARTIKSLATELGRIVTRRRQGVGQTDASGRLAWGLEDLRALSPAKGGEDDILGELARHPEMKSLAELLHEWVERKRDDDYFIEQGQMSPVRRHAAFLVGPAALQEEAVCYCTRILVALGRLPDSNNNVQRVNAINLKGDYLGQSKTRVNTVFRDAADKLLVIHAIDSLVAHNPTQGDSYCEEVLAAVEENMRGGVGRYMPFVVSVSTEEAAGRVWAAVPWVREFERVDLLADSGALLADSFVNRLKDRGVRIDAGAEAQIRELLDGAAHTDALGAASLCNVFLEKKRRTIRKHRLPIASGEVFQDEDVSLLRTVLAMCTEGA